MQAMAKDVGEEPLAHAQEGDFLVDGDQLKREQGVGQQDVYPDPPEEEALQYLHVFAFFLVPGLLLSSSPLPTASPAVESDC